MIPGIIAQRRGGEFVPPGSSSEVLWTPAAISTALWLDADDAATITLVSSAVSQWNDKSGNGCHFSQNDTPGRRPTVQAANLNGLDVIRFDGTDDGLFRAAIGSLGALAAVGVYKSRIGSTPANAKFAFSQRGSGANVERFFMAVGTAAFQTYIGSTSTIINGPAIPDTDWHIHSLLHVGTTHEYNFDGASQGTAAQSDTATPAWAALGHLPGTSGTPSSDANALACDWAELVLVTSLANIDELEGYMAHRWGLETDLAAGHPYKSSPPVI